jgi:hypothetical protein
MKSWSELKFGIKPESTEDPRSPKLQSNVELGSSFIQALLELPLKTRV